ncbi:MAG: hypothetical protein WDN31_02540 [Hyphomicrobium sp.]
MFYLTSYLDRTEHVLERQLAHVAAGRTADGQAGWLPPVDLADNPPFRAHCTAQIFSALLISAHVPVAGPVTERARTALAWKLLTHTTGRSIRDIQCFMGTIALAGYFLSRHPEHIESEMAIRPLAAEGIGLWVKACRKRKQPLPAPYCLEDLRVALAPPERTILWSARERGSAFALAHLTNPFHLFEEGVRLKHCMAFEVDGEAPVLSEEGLKQLAYWKAIVESDGAYSVYSLHHDGVPAATVALDEDTVTDAHVTDELAPVLASALRTVATAHVALKFENANPKLLSLARANLEPRGRGTA